MRRGRKTRSADIEHYVSRFRIGPAGDLGRHRPRLQAASFNPYRGLFGQDVTTRIDVLLEQGPKTPILVAPDPGDPTWVVWRTLLDSDAPGVIPGHLLPAGIDGSPDRRVPMNATPADALLACGATPAMVPQPAREVSPAAPATVVNGATASAPAHTRPRSARRREQGQGVVQLPARTGPTAVSRPDTPRRRPGGQHPDHDRRAPDGPLGGTVSRSRAARTGPCPTADEEGETVISTERIDATGDPAPPAWRAGHAGAFPSGPRTGLRPPASGDLAATRTVAPGGLEDDPAGEVPSLSEVFDASGGRRSAHCLAEAIVVFGGRGGLGKTSVAQALAATGADRGLRVVLVDANVGQGDQHLLLRLDPNQPVPSAYDAARTGHPADAIASPSILNDLRAGRRDRVGFALVAAPPDTIPGAVTAATPAVYRNIVDYAARKADLVVIDTHPISAGEPGAMVTDLILPLLRGGAWGLGLTDSSIPGLHHLEKVLDLLTALGVPADRIMSIINRVPAAASIDMNLLGSRLGRRSHFIGAIDADDEDIPNRSNSGVQLNDVHVMAHRIERVLSRVCDLEVRTAEPGSRRRGRFGLFGRGGRKPA
jgi:MinD-like ATPase involved in chromosome partitioning or flagellar assembly